MASDYDGPVVKAVSPAGRAMEWNGKWYGMEGKFWYGMWKMLRMEWKIIFHSSLLTTICSSLLKLRGMPSPRKTTPSLRKPCK